MKNKTLLPLLELLCMIVIFAISSAFCLRGFIIANTISAKQYALDSSVIIVQNTAETLKASKGDFSAINSIYAGNISDNLFTVYFDKNFSVTTDKSTAKHTLLVRINNNNDWICSATITMYNSNNIIFSIDTGWQEDDQ